MTFKIADRVKETTTTTGTGTLSLAGAMTGFQAFSAALANGDTCTYALQAVDGSGNPTGAWEVGVGTYTTSGNTLSRTLIASSTGSLISLAAGTTQVWLDAPAARFVLLNAAPATGQVPVYTTVTGQYSPTAYKLNALLDVSVTDASFNDGNVVRYSNNQGQWIASPITLAPVPNATLDSSNTGSNLTLSNGNLTATQNNNGAQWGTSRALSPKTSGKWYAECTVVVAGTAGSDGEEFGVVNGNAVIGNGNTGVVGIDTNGVAVFCRQAGFQSGIFYNGAIQSGAASGNFVMTSGMVVGLALDFTLKKIWFYNPTAATWNGDVLANQNPATGTGGFDLTTILAANGTLYLALGALYLTTAPSVTLNPGSSAFSNAVPQGFTAWSANATPLIQDTNVSSPADGDMLVYNAASAKWLNAPAPDSGGIVDGNFDFWDVNTTFSLAAATDTYTADMWVCNAGTGGAATVSQNTPALGSEIAGMTRPRKFRLSYQQTTNASASPTIGQKLEGVGQYNGQSITVSATLAAAVAATDVVGVKYTQNFGTGGSPSTAVTATTTVTWALLTTEKRFSVRLDIPSISGKTLGTGGNDFLRIDLLLATGATYTVYCSQIQVDVCKSTASSDTTGVGGTPLPFRYRGLAAEQVRVQRYLEKSYEPTINPGTVTTVGYINFYLPGTSNGGCTAPVTYGVRKRAAPNPTLYSPNSGTAGKAYDYAASVDVAATAFGPSSRGFNVNVTASGSVVNFGVQFLADARL